MLALTTASRRCDFDMPERQLRAYQRAEVALMGAMEEASYEPRPGLSVRTTFGVLGSKTGAGKTLTLCALIRSTESIDPQERLQSHSTFGTPAVVVRRGVRPDPSLAYSGCTLIVIPHGLQFQWEQELKRAGVAYCRHSSFDASAVACLVTATKLAAFHQLHPRVHFKRLIIDEADSISIRCQPNVRASFVWFVSATYSMLDLALRAGPSKPLYHRCFRQFASTGLDLHDVTVRSDSAWVDQCNDLPPLRTTTVTCAMPAYMNVVMGPGLSVSITDMLSAGDVEGAILAMGGDAQSETNIVQVISDRIREDIRKLQARASYFQHIGSTHAAAAASEAVRTKEQQLTSIADRLAKLREGSCAICLTDLAPAGSSVLTGCCNHLFCGPCLMTWRCRVATCPMCRATGYSITLIKQQADGGGSSSSTAAQQQQPTKEDALLSVISANPQGRFIVFSNYERTFDAIHALLCQHGISCRVLKGTPAAFRKILADHAAGITRVLLMNSKFDGAGHSMQWVTDAITYHRLPPETLTQVTGRGMRPGRTQALHMHHLRWPCEL